MDFPFLPMSIVVIVLASSWIVEFMLVAYAGFMVLHLDTSSRLDQDTVGNYTGILLSAFMLGRTASSYFWGVMSDRYGRRPVVLFSMLSCAGFSFAFGFSTTFWAAFTLRFLLGLCNGMNSLWLTLTSEICTPEHQVVGMGIMTMAWSFGVLVGSGIGGLLAEPATHFPSIFSESGLFGRFPYLLPNVFGGGLAFLSALLAFLFLPETLATAKIDVTSRAKNTWLSVSTRGEDEGVSTPASSGSATDDTGSTSGVSSGGSDDGEASPRGSSPSRGEPSGSPRLAGGDARDGRPSFARASSSFGPDQVVGMASALHEAENGDLGETAAKKTGHTKRTSLLAQPRIRSILLLYGLWAFTSALENLFSLWALSSVPRGGLDWSSDNIGKIFVSSGAMVLLFEMAALPVILRRFGSVWPQRLGSLLLIPAAVLIPSLSSLHGTGYPLVVASVAVMFTIYACLDLFLTDIAVTMSNAAAPEQLGELNGMATTISGVSRMVAPAAWSALFAFSIEVPRPFPFDYHLAFYVMGALRVLKAYLAWDMSKPGVHEHTALVGGEDEGRTGGDERGPKLHLIE